MSTLSPKPRDSHRSNNGVNRYSARKSRAHVAPSCHLEKSETRRGDTLSSPAPRADNDDRTVLARYFSDMAMHPILDIAEELEVARGVVQSEIAHWVALLSWPPAAKPILVALRKRLAKPDTDEVKAPQIPELLRLARRALTSGKKLCPDSAARYTALSQELATALRLADSDRRWMKEARQMARKLSRRVNDQKPQADPRASSRKPAGETRYSKGRPSPSEPSRGYWAEVERTYRVQQDIKNRFVNANLRLVVTIARRFNRGPLSFVDLIQEGNLGLIKAVERFDPSLGYRFSTYASWWIRHGLSRGVANTGRAIRLPVHLADARQRAERASQELIGRLGRQPTLEEVAHETNIPAEKLEQIRGLRAETPLSLDCPANGDEERTPSDWLSDTKTPSPFDCVALRDSREQVTQLLSTLAPNESRILRLRFGLDDGEERTLEQIGGDYQVSRERIRQIQEQALAKLRQRIRRHQGSDERVAGPRSLASDRES